MRSLPEFIKKEVAPPIFHPLKWQNTEPNLPIQSKRLNMALHARV